MNKFYLKRFKRREDGSIYLENAESVSQYVKKMADRLCACREEETLLLVKKDILRDYRDIYVYDVNHAEFPEPIGRFDSQSSQMDFISNRILLQDFGLYLGSTFLRFHRTIYDKYKKLPSIELQGLAIDYSELYERAMDDYIYALKNNCPHAVSASFILPSMIERGLAIALQNRLLYKMLAELCGKIKCQKLLKPFDWEEESCVRFFLTLNESLIFPASEDQIMGKMYDLFVREKILDDTADNRMILVGKDKRMNRTLGSMIRSVFAEKEISAEYLELLKDMLAGYLIDYTRKKVTYELLTFGCDLETGGVLVKQRCLTSSASISLPFSSLL